RSWPSAISKNSPAPSPTVHWLASTLDRASLALYATALRSSDVRRGRMQLQTILAVFAHPDDELSAGGTLARYAASGAHVTLVCVTRGEAGEISDPGLATRETLAEVRTQELLTAAKALGLSDVRFLGFRDSGMVGTPENEDPRSFHQADPAEATRR